MANLDCHLNWELKRGATKINVEDVIKEIKNILTNQWLVLPNQLFLCYLYNDPDNADIPLAKKALAEAAKSNDGQFYNIEACKWVIEANRLCMEKESSSIELRDELIEGYRNFTDSQVATIKALHAYCAVGFGPKGYSDANVLYSEANRLTHYENFLFLYLQALLLAKTRRVQKMGSTASDEEQQLWQKAKEKSEANEVATDSMEYEYIDFLGKYAEAAICFKDMKAAIDTASNFATENFSDEALKLNYKALLKFHKTFRVCRSECTDFTEKVKERMAVLTKRLFDIESADIQDSQFYHTLALERQCETEALSPDDTNGRKEKLKHCESLLLKAQKCATKPGHQFVDLMLVDVQIELRKETHESIQDKYKSLELKYRRSRASSATIKSNRAWHLITKAAQLDEGMKHLKQAVDSDQNCLGRILNPKKIGIKHCLKELNRIGYLGWLDHKLNLESNENLVDIYINYLLKCEKRTTVTEADQSPADEDKTAETQFVTVQLAFLYLQRGQLAEAEQLEHKISDDAEKQCVELERRLTLISVEKKYSAENFQRLATIARSCSERCHEVCTKLLSQLEATSEDKGWNPQSREAYELCATIYLAIEAHGDDSAKAAIETKINAALHISADTEDDMRKHRFQATRHHMNNPTSDDAVITRNSLLLQTIRTAKACLDSCVQTLFPHSRACFPFAYFSMPKTGREEQSRINPFILDSIKDRNVFNSCFQRSFESVKSYKEALVKGTDKDSLKKRNDGLKDFFKRLRDREYGIFTTEGGWLSHWISVRNKNAHSNPAGQSLIEKLEQDLQRDWEFNERNELRGGPCNAYELAHRAAEFAEETRAWFQEAASSLRDAEGRGETS